jgi:hypothetical protein
VRTTSGLSMPRLIERPPLTLRAHIGQGTAHRREFKGWGSDSGDRFRLKVFLQNFYFF